MRKITPEIYRNYEDLPKSMRDAIDAFPWEETIHAIAMRHSLNEKQTAGLKALGVMNLVFMIDSKQLLAGIREELDVTRPIGESIAQDFMLEVAGPIMDDEQARIEKAPFYEDRQIMVTSRYIKYHGKKMNLSDIDFAGPFRIGNFFGDLGVALFLTIIAIVSLAFIFALRVWSVSLGLIGLGISAFGIRALVRGDWHVALRLLNGGTETISCDAKHEAHKLAAAIMSAKDAD